MKHAMNTKTVAMALPAVISTAATSAHTVDTLGYNFAHLVLTTQPAAATDSSTKWVTYTLSHGTTTDASNHTTISGLQGTTNATATSSQFVLPTHNDTELGMVVNAFVNMEKKERILRFVGKPQSAGTATTSLWSATAILGMANHESPDTAEKQGQAASSGIAYG